VTASCSSRDARLEYFGRPNIAWSYTELTSNPTECALEIVVGGDDVLNLRRRIAAGERFVEPQVRLAHDVPEIGLFAHNGVEVPTNRFDHLGIKLDRLGAEREFGGQSVERGVVEAADLALAADDFCLLVVGLHLFDRGFFSESVTLDFGNQRNPFVGGAEQARRSIDSWTSTSFSSCPIAVWMIGFASAIALVSRSFASSEFVELLQKHLARALGTDLAATPASQMTRLLGLSITSTRPPPISEQMCKRNLTSANFRKALVLAAAVPLVGRIMADTC
jgi:hypothetical protein